LLFPQFGEDQPTSSGSASKEQNIPKHQFEP